jgi:16S rRNA G1207 methylase RsmC
MRGRSPPRSPALAPPPGAPGPKRLPLFAALDHATVRASLLGRELAFATARGLFSADRVDDGTRLLLAHLPTHAPSEVLDLGCGYGALGLAIASAHEHASVTLVDRDLVAVAYAERNAESIGLTNARAHGGLGYRDLDPAARFDWVLCNVPARLGERAIAYLMEEGARRLRPHGELRIVVIRDLGPVVERVASDAALPVREVARSTRHRVFSCAPLEAHAPRATIDRDAHEELYARDEVTLDGRSLARPHDLGEDAPHLRDALPLLLDLLPRQGEGLRALVLRGGYGAVALALAARGSEVVAADRDLLATTFTRRNAQRHALELTTRELAWLPDAALPDERFAIIVTETSDSAGPDAARRELTSVRKLLAPGGHALWLTRTKHVADLVSSLERHGRAPRTLAARGAYTVLRDAP